MKTLSEWRYGTVAEKRLLERCRDIVLAIEPGAEVILYGSRVRGKLYNGTLSNQKGKTMNRDEIILLLRRFKKMNRHNDNIVRIGLFGSAARGDMGEKSDIDIVVQLKTQDLFDLIGIKLDLEEELRTPVDIVSYREKMNEFLKKRIDKEAVYV